MQTISQYRDDRAYFAGLIIYKLIPVVLGIKWKIIVSCAGMEAAKTSG